MIKLQNFDINLKDTITCGQCFRFYEENDGSFTIILKDRVINIKNDEYNNLFIESDNEENLEEIIIDYFDLERNYDEINQILLKKDKTLNKCIKDSKGLKILKQEPFEMLISYIISQNNKVSRISNSVNYLCERYGKKVVFRNKEYYLFPTIDQIKNISLEVLKESKVGFRDKYILSVIENINNGNLNIESITNMNTNDALEYLEKMKGIGPKVASCILLFGYSRFDVFPIDTWVKKAMSVLYSDIGQSQKNISEFAKEKYGEYCGIALQYMYHSMRNIK